MQTRNFNRNILHGTIVIIAWVVPVLGQGQHNLERLKEGGVLHAAFQRALQDAEERDSVQRELEETPSEVVLPELFDALASGPNPLSAELRELAYRVLVHHKDMAGVQGNEQLVRCLDDPTPRIQRICGSALGSDEMARHTQSAIEALKDDAVDHKTKEAILKKLAGWGSLAGRAYPVVRNIFLDPSADERLRWLASRSMLEIGGMGEALRDSVDTDATGLKVLMWALPYYIGKASTDYGGVKAEDIPFLPKARELALKALKNERSDIRQAALEAILTVFGDEVAVLDEQNRPSINPMLRAALEEMALHDFDESLRRRAQTTVEQFPEVLDAVVRRKARAERRVNDVSPDMKPRGD